MTANYPSSMGGSEVVFLASGPPTATDDATTCGAREGNRWHDQTADEWWLCSNATTGAAVWRKFVGTTVVHCVRVRTVVNTLNNAVVSGGVLRFDTIDFDSDVYAPVSSPFSTITIPSGLGGTYLVNGWSSGSGTQATALGMGILVNGAAAYSTTNQTITGPASVNYTLDNGAVVLIKLNAGDTVQLINNSTATAAFTAVTMGMVRIDNSGPAGPIGPVGPAGAPGGGSGTVTSVTAGTGLSGGTITTAGTIAIATAGVTNAMLVNMPASTIKANNTAGATAPLDLTVAQAQTLLAVPAVSATTPIMDSVANIGTLTTYARADHVHASDTSRLATAGGSVAGTLSVGGFFTCTSNIGLGLPTSAGSGTGIGWNLSGGARETDFLNTGTLATTSFNFYQYTAATTTQLLASMTPSTLTLSVGLAMATSGMTMGSALASSTIDLSRHIALFGTTYGFGITSGALNVVAAGTLTMQALAGGVALLGVPTAPTAASGTSTTQLATTAFVQAESGNVVRNTAAATAVTHATTDGTLIMAPSAACTLTLLAAATYPGRMLRLKLTTAFAVNSATANVVPLVGGSATTAILAATAGKYCLLQSDGTAWQIVSAN